MENEVKEPAPKYNYISPEKYLEIERLADGKHEYYKGEVFAMAGASWEHNVICYNINRVIVAAVHSKGCKLFGSDFRVHIPENTFFTYPDFSIVCGDQDPSLMYADNLINPLVIIEILSQSTRNYDRGTKFQLYRRIQTLQEYILIDSTTISVELYKRQTDNSWILTEFKNLTDNFYISSISLCLFLKDIYEDVNLNE